MKKHKPNRFHNRPWFKPARFWNYFAAYYPVTGEGWLITLATLGALVLIVGGALEIADSVTNAMVVAAPFGIAVLLIFDLASFRTGEFPKWWRKH